MSSISCYAVWLVNPNKQLRVFVVTFDASLAFNKAKSFADAQAENGYPCIIEEYSMHCPSVGKLAYTTITIKS